MSLTDEQLREILKRKFLHDLMLLLRLHEVELCMHSAQAVDKQDNTFVHLPVDEDDRVTEDSIYRTHFIDMSTL